MIPAASSNTPPNTGPVIAIVLTLCAVFVPIAFLGGLTGELYRQFAVTIAIAVVISQNIVRMAVFLLFTLMGVAGLYFLLCFPLSQWSRSLERSLHVAR